MIPCSKECLGNVPQSKTSKMKVSIKIKFVHITKVYDLINIIFSLDGSLPYRETLYLNFNLVFADAMALDDTLYLNETDENSTTVTFLLPFLRGGNLLNINTRMGRMITDLMQGGTGKSSYSTFRIPLPSSSTAASIRVGVIN